MTETQLRENNGEDRPLVIDFDFNYDINTPLNRIHNDELIMSINCLILDKMKIIFDFSSNTKTFPLYVFQRTKPYICDKKKCVKDGIHLLIGVKMNTLQQIILRDMVIADIHNIIDELPLINIGEVYDSVSQMELLPGNTSCRSQVRII